MTGVEEIFKLGEGQGEIDIFDDDYLNKISKIKLPNTKIMMLQKMLAKAIGDMKKVNLAQGIDFTQRFKALVEKYNERKEDDVLVSEVLEDFSDEIINMFGDLKAEMGCTRRLRHQFRKKKPFTTFSNHWQKSMTSVIQKNNYSNSPEPLKP